MTRVGIIGAGQLGRMLGIAARSLGVQCTFLDPAPSPPAVAAGTVIASAFDDPKGLRQLADASDVITYEFENVPVESLHLLEASTPVYPSAEALHHAQDRVREKRLFESLDIPLPAWRAVDTDADLRAAAESIGLPLVVKTRRFGYDGKGQAILRSADDIVELMRRFDGQALVAEEHVRFDHEVSGIGVRGRDGSSAIYPLTQNEHRDGILRVSRAPAGDEWLAERAAVFLTRLMSHLDYVGVLALEFFVRGDRLLANEFAPRVHNSGHWTIEGAATSQFENHLRAVLDRTLGRTEALGHAGMVNLIGAMPSDPDALARSGVYLHDYGKSPRPGRKLGHVTLLDAAAAARDARLARIDAILRH